MINRKILASMVVISAVGVVAGSATFAEFSDQETSEDNVFTAGAIDLKLDWQEAYDKGNGLEPVEAYPDTDGDDEQDEILDRDGMAQHLLDEGEIPTGPNSNKYGDSVTYSELGNNDQDRVEKAYRNQFTEAEPIFNLDDVKPGDTGEATISTHVFDNPAWLWLRFEVKADDENTVTEPEADADGEDNAETDSDLSGDGELAENVMITVWNDDGDNVFEPCGTDDQTWTRGNEDGLDCSDRRTDEGFVNGENPEEEGDTNGGDNPEELIYYGPADEFNQEANQFTNQDRTLGEGVLVDGEPFTDESGDDFDFQPHPNSTTNYIGVKWHLPFETGNEVQTDSMEMNMDFYAQQYRHNSNPNGLTNPWTDQ